MGICRFSCLDFTIYYGKVSTMLNEKTFVVVTPRK